MKDIILQTQSLTKQYGHRTVVDQVSMTIYEGDIYGFIGKTEPENYFHPHGSRSCISKQRKYPPL